MKRLSLLVLIGLFGCSSQPTLEELETEAAEQTGDWEAVDDRARMVERMSATPELKCPEHLMLICVKEGEHEECYCQARR